ncbi:uncharacterized protein LOC117319320 [Pecten maximus]|uniref:uncharacterized protein LOC117319320 n=1 Tax=Pecten maximus TaxID=6579 RepID=UPI001457E899|nr:uncharacterized protein LOC117319320 [Pecten maximus]
MIKLVIIFPPAQSFFLKRTANIKFKMASQITDTQLVKVVEEFGDLDDQGNISGVDPFERFFNETIEWSDSIVARETSTPKQQNASASIILIEDEDESPRQYQQ